MNGFWASASLLQRAAAAIGFVTVVSGATQAAAPGLVLRMVGAQNTAATRQLFATVGMFMTIAGGILTQASVRHRNESLVLGWSTAQKLGAVAAVGVGVHRGVFSRRALAVAAFDLVSAVALAAGAVARAVADRRVRRGHGS